MTENEVLQVLCDIRTSPKNDPPEVLHLSDEVHERYQRYFRLSHETLSQFPTRQSFWDAVVEWNERNDPPLPVTELERTFSSAL